MYPPIHLDYCFHEYQWDLHHNTGFSLLIFLSDIDLIQDPEEIWTTVPYLQSRQDQVWFHCGPVSLLQLWCSIVEVIVCMWISKTSSVCITCITCITVYHTYNMWTCISNISLILASSKFRPSDMWYALFLICQFILGGREGWMVFRGWLAMNVIFFIHYLPKNKTPFVEMVYLMYMQLHHIFQR